MAQKKSNTQKPNADLEKKRDELLLEIKEAEEAISSGQISEVRKELEVLNASIRNAKEELYSATDSLDLAKKEIKDSDNIIMRNKDVLVTISDTLKHEQNEITKIRNEKIELEKEVADLNAEKRRSTL